jgi:hypothetical protein
MRTLLFLAIATLALGSSGCVAATAVESVQGKAFVVKGTVFGTSLWNCEAAGAQPVCYEVEAIPYEGD